MTAGKPTTPLIAQPYGSRTPWVEPAWYNALASPYYSESHHALRKFVREYIQKYVEPFQAEWEEAGAVPKEETIRYGRAGLAFQDMPEQYRKGVSLLCGIAAKDWDIFHFLILHHEQSVVFSGVQSGLAGGSVIGAPPIVHVGTDEQKMKWLPGIFTGETMHCLGATEPSGGSDLANLKTTAVKSKDGKTYLVNGHKKWITAATTSTHMTTAVRTGEPGAKGVSVLVIDLKSPGITIRKIKNSGCNAGGSAWVTLENVVVPAENLLGEENNGFPALMGNFNRERLIIAVIMNGKARKCMADAFEYAHDRQTFGKPLIDNQVIRAKFTTLARYIESHWAWIEQIAYHAKVSGGVPDELSSRIALAKIHGGRLLELASREGQQVLGGAGYQKGGIGGQIEQITRDMRMLIVGGGSEEIISDLAVRQEMMWARRRGSAL